MLIAVPRESVPAETRLALLPAEVKRLCQLPQGVEVAVETGLGTPLQIPDQAYLEAGARRVLDRRELLQTADAVLRFNPPPPEELAWQKPESLQISFLQPFRDFAPLATALEHQLSLLALELMPRSTRAQSMDALSSQASLAGYAAVILGARYLDRVLPMMTTPAGTLAPARVLVLGAGVAGLQAIATAHRLGARVEAFDLRPEAQEQILSLGARAIRLEEPTTHTSAEAPPSGYAPELEAETQARQQAALKPFCARSDLLITTAQVFGRPAPQLVNAEAVAAMAPGSVIVDLASESGGNVVGCPQDAISEVDGITLIGLHQLARQMPRHASQMYSANLFHLLQYLLEQQCWSPEEQRWQLQHEDEIVSGLLLTHLGALVHPRLRQFWKEKF